MNKKNIINSKKITTTRFYSPRNTRTKNNYIYSPRKFSPRNTKTKNIQIKFENSNSKILKTKTYFENLTKKKKNEKKSFKNFFKMKNSNLISNPFKKNNFINSRNFFLNSNSKKKNLIRSKKNFERSPLLKKLDIKKKNIKLCRSFENINRYNIFSNSGKSTKYESKINFSNKNLNFKNSGELKIKFIKIQKIVINHQKIIDFIIFCYHKKNPKFF